MFSGIKVGRIRGIPVVVNWTLLIAGALFTYLLATSQFPLAAPGAAAAEYWVAGAVGAFLFFVCVGAHELSHSVVAQRNGVTVERITLWLLGGVAQLSGRVGTAGAEFRIAIAGPLMSVALGAAFGGVSWALVALGAPDVMVALFVWLAIINVVLAVFNLAPAAPLDGGRVLAAALWAVWRDKARAQLAAANVGRVFGVLLCALGVAMFFIGESGLWFILLGWFVFAVATAERRVARLERAVGTATVREVMNPHPVTVPGWITVDYFWSSPPLGHHHVYPVARWEGGVHGAVRVERLDQVPLGARTSVRVQDLADPAPEARPDELVVDVLERANGPLLMVVEGGQLVGVVTAEDLLRLQSGQSASTV
ncbi:MAG: site-2 protease family protein [Acidimicrobiia bacterium]